jgi:hypothetical protein
MSNSCRGRRGRETSSAWRYMPPLYIARFV